MNDLPFFTSCKIKRHDSDNDDSWTYQLQIFDETNNVPTVCCTPILEEYRREDKLGQ